ncbi:MAG: substrate-binding periplasmic protein [Endozoicomonas sp.]
MKWWIPVLCTLMLTGTAFGSKDTVAEDITSSLKRRTLTFSAPVWDGYTHKDGTGLYWEILREVYEPLGFKLRLKNMPWNRGMKLMTDYRIIDGVPGEGLASDYENLTFSQYPLEPEYLAILYRKGQVDSFLESPDLTGKVVGWRKGYNLLTNSDSYGNYLLKEFFDLKKGMSMLQSGSLEVLVDELAEIEAIAEQEQIDLEQYEIAEFVTGDYYYMAYGDTHISKPLADIFDARIEELARKGWLQEVYAKWEIDLPEPVRALSDQ